MLRIIITLMAVIYLSACSLLTPKVTDEPIIDTPNPEPIETLNHSNDANDIIDQANQDLFDDLPFVGPPTPKPTPLIWDRLVSNFSLPECQTGSVEHTWQDWYGNHPEYMQRVLVRARPWLYDIIGEIETRGLPYELALLPIVESAYDTFAFSSAAAVGGWQFTAPTARDYGLKINSWYDGRRDMYAATRAALNYLTVLFKRFDNNWRLALAGYNAGIGRVSRAIARHGGEARSLMPNDLRLPKETLGFSPKLHGLSCLLRNPQHYSLTLPLVLDIPLITAVELEQPLDLVYAAHLAELPIAELYALNPGLNRWSTPPDGPHRLILPADKLDDFLQKLNASQAPETVPAWHTITVQSGDTLSQLARLNNTTIALLREQNSLTNNLIFPGQILRTGAASYNQIPNYAESLAELQSLQQGLIPTARTQHRIRPGESLSTIAKRYSVSISNLQSWNQISDPHRIRAGQNLVVLAGVKPSNNQRYRVQPGDSLWLIARRHKLTVEALRNWNQLPINTILQPGQVLRLAPNL